MDKNKFIKDNFGISDKTLKLVSEAEESIKEQFKHIENICEINQSYESVCGQSCI